MKKNKNGKNTKSELEEEIEEQEAMEEINIEETEETQEELIKRLNDENADKVLRLQAEFDNYRKRVSKEKEDIYTLSLEKIMIDILPIIDNFERAIETFKKDNLDGKYIDGLKMINSQLMTVLIKYKLTEIDCLDKEFDPNFHYAVTQCEAGDDDENKIKMVMQKGYMLGNRVIRPAMVSVAVK